MKKILKLVLIVVGSLLVLYYINPIKELEK